MADRHPLVQRLSGGDRRSIGEVDAVVQEVRRAPELVDLLFAALDDEDAVIRMRAADALEKLTRERPELLIEHKQELLDSMLRWTQQEIRWHVAAMVPRLPLTAKQRKRAAEQLEVYLDDPSAIVRTCAMQGLAELAMAKPGSLPWVEPLIEELTKSGTAAMRARGRKLLERMRK